MPSGMNTANAATVGIACCHRPVTSRTWVNDDATADDTPAAKASETACAHPLTRLVSQVAVNSPSVTAVMNPIVGPARGWVAPGWPDERQERRESEDGSGGAEPFGSGHDPALGPRAERHREHERQRAQGLHDGQRSEP